MAELQEFSLKTAAGKAGRVFRRSRFLDRNGTNHVRLDDGTEFDVPASALHVQPDGSFLLDEEAGPAPDAVKVITRPPGEDEKPVIEEKNMADKREERILQQESKREERRMEEKRVENGALVPEGPLFGQEVSVEHVPVNRLVEGPIEVWQDGDTTVIPVVEEVLTMQKRLMLKEEIRITRRRTEIREPRKIVLDQNGR